MSKFVFFKRKECIRPTFMGWLFIFSFIFLFAFLFMLWIPQFLSQHKPVQGNILMLDGQVPDFAIEQAIDCYQSGDYQLIITSGSKIPSGYFVANMQTMADLTRATFLKLGLDSTEVIAVPTSYVLRDRTFHSAQTLHQWLADHSSEVKSIDIVTVGCHARRSRVLFQKALGDQYKVGVICIEDPSFELKRWWKSSIGARVVISETIAYTYVRLFQ